jgi:signal transduction histidine kinase
MDSPVEARERDVRFFLGIVNDFGSSTESFFGRIYHGLRRKQVRKSDGRTEQILALQRANRELTAQVREARTVSARLQAIFARIDEGVVMQDTDGRIVHMNESAHRLLGSVKAFWDSELGRLFAQAQERRAAQTDELQPAGPPIRVQINDQIIGAQLAYVATPTGEPLGTLIVIRDVTREALADRLRDEFVTQISHELRTPLTVIKGMSEVLINQPADRPPNHKFLEAIGRNAAILDRMIVELLDISEISAGAFEVRRTAVALDEVILDVLKGQQAQIKAAGLQAGLMIRNPARTRILGDDRRLRWAIGHLLDNSIKYTLKGGLITVRVGAVRSGRVLIDVIDNGVGISDADLPHVFERFYRGQAKTPDGKTIDPRGLGQGLFVARAVAEAHGGFLTVASNTGQGSGTKFTLGLPIVES